MWWWEEHGFWNQTDVSSNLGSLIYWFVISDKLANLSVPQLSYLKGGIKLTSTSVLTIRQYIQRVYHVPGTHVLNEQELLLYKIWKS